MAGRGVRFIRKNGKVIPIRSKQDSDKAAHAAGMKAYKKVEKNTAYNRGVGERAIGAATAGAGGALFGGALGLLASEGVSSLGKKYGLRAAGKIGDAVLIGSMAAGALALGKFGARKKGYDNKKAVGAYQKAYKAGYKRASKKSKTGIG